jgi:hypothetical protein
MLATKAHALKERKPKIKSFTPILQGAFVQLRNIIGE